MKRNCLHCGKDYETDNRNAKYCSRDCTTDARVHQRFTKPMITRAYNKLSPGERFMVKNAADNVKVGKMGDVMALNLVAHLGAWLEENSD